MASTSTLCAPATPDARGEDEERHAGHADRLRLGDFGAHRFDVVALGEQFLHQFAVHAAFARDLDEQGAVADVAALVEIELEQALDDLVLRAGGEGPADQPMRVERVGRAGDRSKW